MASPYFITVTLCLISLALPARAGELRLTVENIRSSSGTILIGLYDSAQSFDNAIEMSDKAGFLNDPQRVAGAALRANADRKAGTVFLNVRPGRYAIIVFQDENTNGRLDKTPWGVPTEPYGFSNNAQGFLGPPTFNDAAMALDTGDHSVSITLIYHGDPSAWDSDATTGGSGSTELAAPRAKH